MCHLFADTHFRVGRASVATQVQFQERLSFGDYELDCRTGELRRNGSTLKLQPQPAKVLAILASRAGEVVTRQELTEQVWGADTYVDFEHGLNFAVRQIRSVLQGKQS
jgi:DNA-binding winged helix-turn-helix (wHTH) protein